MLPLICMVGVHMKNLCVTRFSFPASPQADIVLCSILDRLQPQWIVSYHEHDSLLKHLFDEELTEEDLKAAWEKYKVDMAAASVQYVAAESVQYVVLSIICAVLCVLFFLWFS